MMTRGVAILGLVLLGFGAKHFVDYAAYRRSRRERREALNAWEGEGGAVPVAASRTAAQITPTSAPEVVN
jgi:hypothetical protein